MIATGEDDSALDLREFASSKVVIYRINQNQTLAVPREMSLCIERFWYPLLRHVVVFKLYN